MSVTEAKDSSEVPSGGLGSFHPVTVRSKKLANTHRFMEIVRICLALGIALH
jgi:hypothetical protein